ncbi:DNA methyltransferase [Ornithinimicrobium sediminis]|uniref:DNA methyltransferase n=1 Tax=Ornithinimicrobium sediminis TaxID=2904603 RepID=UPI001E5E864F|nr:DNA methyltransferase [Ornithinimicrobium sediminis]MCE0487371.1 N-6 DNA methylase [Ornithinimicrobium sediminis]
MPSSANLPMPQLQQNLAEFALWRKARLRGDEKGEAQPFLDRLFRALGHEGVQDAGAEFESRLRRRDDRGTGFADLLWKPRVLIEMKKAGTPLRQHYRQAFDYWVRAVPNRPRYVVLCNFDDFWIYDFENQLDEPIDTVALDELEKRWETLSFLFPTAEEPVFGNDLVKVTREAASQVAQVFSSLKTRGVPTVVAQRFVLQGVMAMFSEDIGLLPRHSYSEALSDSRNGSEAYDLIGGLFREMNTPGVTAGGRFAGTPYFNGGLFSHVSPQELTRDEINLLREAAITNWADVRPEIFGTLFEGSMDKGERHAQGAHFTSQADIAKIVGPCVVEPWRERIDAATTVPELEALLHSMLSYRVLDPACGSGNFLYVAYREMRRLEHAVVEKLMARRRGVLTGQTSLTYVDPENFLGIDTNPFAVEIAKVTMQLGKKLAADELDEDRNVLPLDNLDGIISCSDALFTPWPRADTIIGNPPYLGRRSMVRDLGAAYVAKLDAKYGPQGVADFVTYWFPRAHDHLRPGGRAGFVGTKSIKQGDGRRASLDYIVDNDGVIFDAVSQMPWSGEAQVTVSIVNWQKGGQLPAVRTLWMDDGERPVEVAEISGSLSPLKDLRTTVTLRASEDSFFQGQTFGVADAFKVDGAQARELVRAEPSAAEVLHPVLGGREMLHKLNIDDWVIDIPEYDSDQVWAKYPKLLTFLEPTAMQDRQFKAQKQAAVNREILQANPRARVNVHHIRFADHWWMLGYRRADMLEALDGFPRYIALTRTSSELRGPVFTFVDPGWHISDSAVAFPFADDYSLGILQSNLHTEWFREKCTTLETRLTYTAKNVGGHFPWPQDPHPDAAERVARAAAAIVDHRAAAFGDGRTLAQQYDVLRRPGRSTLRDLHTELDSAVLEAYGLDPAIDVLTQLLALNHLVAERERAGEAVTRPGAVNCNCTFSNWAFPAPEL